MVCVDQTPMCWCARSLMECGADVHCDANGNMAEGVCVDDGWFN